MTDENREPSPRPQSEDLAVVPANTLSTLDTTIKQALELRGQVTQAQQAKAAAERSFQQQLKQQQEKHAATTENVAVDSSANSQVDSLTAEKAQLFERLDKKDLEIKDKQHELDSVKKALTTSKQAIVELESKVDNLRAANGTASTTEQDLNKNIELLKEHINYLENEATLAKHTIRDSNSNTEQISALRQKLQILQESFSELDKQHDELKENNMDLTRKHLDAISRVSELENIQKLNQESFQVEMDAQKKLVALWEKSAETAKARVQHLEKIVASRRSESSSDASVTTPAEPTTPKAKKSTPDLSTMFSPAAQRIAGLQKGGNSLTKIYSDLQSARSELEREKTKNRGLQEELNSLLQEMESHTPAIIAERQENQRLENELNSLGSQLETASVQFTELTSSLRENESLLEQRAEETKSLKTQVHDLSRQLKQVMFEKQDLSTLTEEDKEKLQLILDGEDIYNLNTNNFISEKLVPFTNIVDLQQQNENLLKLTRKLQRDAEETEGNLRRRIEEAESAAVNEVKSTIEDLQANIGSLQTKIDTLERERDMYRTVAANRKENSHDNKPVDLAYTAKVEQLIVEKRKVEKTLEEVSQEYKSYKSETIITLKTLDDQIVKLSNENSVLQVQISKTTTQLELSVDRFKTLEGNYENLRTENESHKKRTDSFQDSLLKQEERNEELSKEVASVRSTFAKFTKEVSNLQEEKRLWKSVEERLEREKVDLVEERDRLSTIVSGFKSLESERAEYEKKSSERIAVYEQENTNLRETILSHEEKVSQLEATIVSEAEKIKASEERTLELTQKLTEAAETVQQLKKTIVDHDEKLFQAVNEVQTRLEKEKAVLEEQMAQFTQRHADEIEALTKKNEQISNDLRAKISDVGSENIEADANYNAEVSRHAETTTKLQTLSEEYNLLQQQITELTNTVEVVSANLVSSENIWDSERMSFSNQINSLKLQIHDTLEQKTELQKKLDEKLQNDVPPTYEESAATVASLSQTIEELRKDVETLRANNTQLQEEKEIFETNQNLIDQELKRLRRNLDYKISEVEGYKIDLQNVTERKIQPLVDDNSILKESNIALREQRDEFSKQAVKLGEELKKLKGMDSQLAISLSELKKKDEALKELNAFKAKLNGVEPEKVCNLQRENDALKKSTSSLTSQLLSQQTELLKLKAELTAKSQENSADLQQKLQEAEAKATKFESDFKALEVRLGSLRTEFQDKMNTRRIQAKNTLLEATTAHDKLLEEMEVLKKSTAEQTAQSKTITEELTQTKQKLTELEESLKAKENEIDVAKTNIAAKETELQSLKSQTESQPADNTELETVKQKLVLANENVAQLETEKLNLNEMTQKLQVELDTFKTAAASTSTAIPMTESANTDSSAATAKITELEGHVGELKQKLIGLEELEKQKNALQAEIQNIPVRVSEAVQKAEAEKAALKQQLEILQSQQQQTDHPIVADASQQSALDLALSEKAALELQLEALRTETEQQKVSLAKTEKLQPEKSELEKQLESLHVQQDLLALDGSDEAERLLELETAKSERVSLEQQLKQERLEKAELELKIASLTTNASATPVPTSETDEDRKQRALIEFNLSTPEQFAAKLGEFQREHSEKIAAIEQKLLDAKTAELESIKSELKTELSKAHEKQLAEIKLKAQTKIKEAVEREKERLAEEYKAKSVATASAPTPEAKPVSVTAETIDPAVKEQILTQFRVQAEADKTAALNKLRQETEMRTKLLQMKLAKLQPQTAIPATTATPALATPASLGGPTGPAGNSSSVASGSSASLGNRLSGIPRASGIPRPNMQAFVGGKRQAPGGSTNGVDNATGNEPGNKRFKRSDNGTANKK